MQPFWSRFNGTFSKSGRARLIPFKQLTTQTYGGQARHKKANLQKRRGLLHTRLKLELATVESQIWEEEMNRYRYIDMGYAGVRATIGAAGHIPVWRAKIMSWFVLHWTYRFTTQKQYLMSSPHQICYSFQAQSALGISRAAGHLAPFEMRLCDCCSHIACARKLLSSDLIKFDGSSTRYLFFMSSINARIANKSDDRGFASKL